MGRILRDAIISFGFMAVFFGASSLFASGKRVKPPPVKVAQVNERRLKFLAALRKAVKKNDAGKVVNMLKSVAYPKDNPDNTDPAMIAMLRNPDTRAEVLGIIEGNPDVAAVPSVADLVNIIRNYN